MVWFFFFFFFFVSTVLFIYLFGFGCLCFVLTSGDIPTTKIVRKYYSGRYLFVVCLFFSILDFVHYHGENQYIHTNLYILGLIILVPFLR